MKKAIWLTYDLGIQGDYESLYQWLDSQEAIECGDNLAFFSFESDGSSIPDQIKRQMQDVAKESSRARIYVIWGADKRIHGKFIFGQRKAPPWSGYAPKPSAGESGLA